MLCRPRPAETLLPGRGIWFQRFTIFFLPSRSWYASLYNKAFFIIKTICVRQCLFIIFMEEFLVSKGFNLLIDPVQQGFISLGYCRSDRILASKGRDVLSHTV